MFIAISPTYETDIRETDDSELRPTRDTLQRVLLLFRYELDEETGIM